MNRPKDLISPRQAAEAIGVSESSLKRWCDQGKIKSTRTEGGHRRIDLADVVDFAHRSGYKLVAPELIGLGKRNHGSEQAIDDVPQELAEALLNGDELTANRIVLRLFSDAVPLWKIFDQVIAPAFHQIGYQWECDDAEVYQERRSCQICQRIINNLRQLLSPYDKQLVAIGGTLEGDIYSIPTMMAELVLISSGFSATSLGSNIPADSLLVAIEDLDPKIFWLSVSHIRSRGDFIEQFGRLSNLCLKKGIPLIIGGRALDEELRRQIAYSSYCDTMHHLYSFAETFRRNDQSMNAIDLQTTNIR